MHTTNRSKIILANMFNTKMIVSINFIFKEFEHLTYTELY